ncbi:ABC transporter permease subunit [Sutcliffiella rhizosphaerae]|uniref:ABC transmembrane type-1 domain-containing protein n=1 Tax=Sutcliffiella rhizosphaerae TaxID=2880967 RepID=A0ABN8A5T5_9BACI|nr:ABC transporter permease subunit [Sutcliffiella rhizosphaerae]CAG9620443.1 hypothetical protein BACCIP111883_01211 [Sutcliffiella rhizosphaerae]
MDIKKETIKLSFSVVMALIFMILLVLFPRTQNFYLGNTVEMAHLGIQPFFQEYKANIVHFFQHIKEHKSLGGTMFSQTSVEKELIRYYPKSLLVIAIAFLLSITLGVYKGIFDYKNKHSKKNILGNGTTWLFQAIPDFFIVIIAFYLAFYYLPMGLIFSNKNWYSFAAPALLVAIYPMMYVARLTSMSLLHQDGSDYIRTAFAKGNKIKEVINRHILKNSMMDLVTHLPTIMIVVISNMLMVEYLTGYAGAGNRIFIALGGRQNQVGLGSGQIEPGLVIGFGLCFLATILVVHILKLVLMTKFSQRGA